MANDSTTLVGRIGWSGAAVWAILSLAGCGRQSPAPESQAGDLTAAKAVAGGSAENPAAAAASDPRWQQSFAEATVAYPPPDQRPPDLTLTRKSVGKLYTEVVQLWDGIRFFSPAGKPLRYRAVLDTDLGEVEITLRPHLAPNHVRSFIALSRAGYYDGLVFERTIHEQVEDQPDVKFELIEAGCPLGTGESGLGSIGYWLKPEFSAESTHEEGTVGACHGEEADTAACKFYINLTPAPFMNGQYTVFGKVTRGLDVARKILSLPVRSDAENPEGDRPETPVAIRKVSIIVDGDAAIAKAN